MLRRKSRLCRHSTPLRLLSNLDTWILQPIISLTLFVKLSLTAQCSPACCKSISFKTLVSTKRKLSLCKLKFNRSRCFEAGSTQKRKCSGNSWYGGCGIDLWQRKTTTLFGTPPCLSQVTKDLLSLLSGLLGL